MKYFTLLLITVIIFSSCQKKEFTQDTKTDTSGTLTSGSSDLLNDTLDAAVPCGSYSIVDSVYENGDTDSTVTFYVTYPSVTGHPDMSIQDKINAQLRGAALTNFQSLEEGADISDDDFVLRMAEETGEMSGVYYGEVKYELGICGDNFLSVRYDFFGNLTPSAHPSAETKCININTKTGEIVPVTYFLKEGTDFRKVFSDRIRADMMLQGLEYSEPDLMNDHTYYMNNDSLFIAGIFSSYAGAGYELGIPFTEIKSMLNDEAIETLGIK